MKRSNNKRRFFGGGRRPDLKEFKREEALERQVAFAALSVFDKIALLDSRLGKGLGAKKQRAKLASAADKKVEVK